MQEQLIYLIFIFFLSVEGRNTLINPLKNPKICGRPECNVQNAKFHYEQNRLYRYDYKLQVKTEFLGSGQNTSDLFLSGYVEISFPESCQGLLKMNSIELKDRIVVEKQELEEEETEYYEPEEILTHPHSEEMAAELGKYDLTFSYHDGVISEICPDENEPVWVLNLKKGILSSYQNTMLRFDMDYNTTETDVSGVCKVVYTLIDTAGTSLIIQKTKEISSCKNRYKTNSVLQTSPYEFRENYAAWPFLQSTSYCNISIDRSIYSNINCYERHLLIPFSNENKGAVTESLITLTLTEEDSIDQSDDDKEHFIKKRTSLLFDHTPSVRMPHGEIKSSRELLNQMCELGFPDIKRGFTEVFTEFVSTAKLLSYHALQQLLNRASSICERGRYHLLESLPYIGSTASVQLMKEQILNKTVPNSVATGWMLSLSFITRPSLEMLEQMYSLAVYGKQNEINNFILGASAVVHTFCSQNPNCIAYKQVSSIIELFETDIYEQMHNIKSRKSMNYVIVLIKAFGNIGVVTNRFAATLKTIIEDSQYPIEIRIEAINAHRRLNCEANKEYFLNVYQDVMYPTEIRIKSYLQSMNCPDYQSIRQVIGILERESVNQVGSFVWSHLNNIANSASPSKIYTQGFLVGANIPNKFKLDIRKFSRNYEKSLFFEEFNFGGSAEANVIFGTESYLPREISINITADLFGESVNFIEINSRYQGFEKIVESYFGPRGPINAQKFMNKINEYSSLMKNFIYGDSTYALQNLRELSDLHYPAEILEKASELRDDITEFGHRLLIEDEYDDYNSNYESQESLNQRDNTTIQGLKQNVDNLDYKLQYKYSEPRATVGIKIFGNELQYSAVDGLHELMMAISWLNPSSITKLLTAKEIAYTKSGVLLDSNYAVPLSTGLPLTLELLGVSSVDVRLSGLWNNPGFKKTHSLDVESNIKPSLSLDFQTSMKTDFFYGASGIRIKTNMHSSSAVESKLKIRGTRLVSLQFSLPQNRNEIFSAKSELFVLLNEQPIPQTGISKRFANSTCTWPFIDQAVGLKLCSNYEMPDVSNSSNYPSLILSGPANIDIYLDKADPTAKMFVFEYRSDITPTGSVKLFLFETPDSAIVRKFLANVTSDNNIINISMSFEHGSQKHLALGSYKDTINDKHLEFALHLNGERNLALEIGLNRTDLRNGAVFYPKFFLIVNEERIAGLTGFVKKTEKNDKTHYDVDITFETKKLQSKILGFFSKTEASFSTNLNLNYRFSDTNLEQLNIQGELADRSHKGRTELVGFFRHESTAYPRYNFMSKMKLRSGVAHYEARFDINNAPDFEDPNYNLGLQFSFAKAEDFISQKKTKAVIEIVRPISNLNLKLLIKHEQFYKNGVENNVVIMFRFAAKKEASAIISVYHPQGIYYTVDSTANITIPGFTPCTIALKITETRPKDYQINFKGIWFSSHEVRINGFYQDRSSFVKSFHHLKLMAFSPSFDDTMIDARYAHDENDFKVDGQLQYGPSGYGVILKKSQQYGNNRHLYAELKWIDQMYWISTNLLLDQSKQLMVEIHLDKDRDIHLVLRGMSTDLKKDVGIEIKWNANRDPSHKLAISGEFNTPKSKIYNGLFYVTYPNRTFSGLFDLDLSSQDYRGSSRISWSVHDVVIFKFNFGSDLRRTKDLWLNLNLETPFDGWKNNLIESKFHYSDTKLLFNTALLWAENQNLGLDFFGNYKLSDKIIYFEVIGGINSTLKDVPAVNIFFKHNQNVSQLNTELTVKKNSFSELLQIYSIKSSWKMDNDSNYQNVSGVVALKSPYKGYTNGGLAAKFSLNENRNLIGAVDFELEARKYTLLVNGHIKKFTDNMLTINITTPIEKFKLVTGRFGINERDRHFVAEIRTPETALGAEILFQLVSSSDFDIIFNLQTPLEAFEKIILIAKLKQKTIDFRGGWNKMLLGFVGIWRMENLADFEYSYKVFTPLQNFEENGIAARYIESEYDLEMSVKIAQYKLGLLLLGQSKPKLINELGLQEPFKVYSDLFEENFRKNNDYEDYEEEEDDDYEPINFNVYMELDVIIWPTVKGEIRLAESDFTYICYGSLDLTVGIIELRDRFYYPDILNIKNELIITTPFEKCKEVKSIYQSSIDIFKQYVVGVDVSFLNNDIWLESGLFLNFTNSTDESDMKNKNIILNLKTPLENLPRLNIQVHYENEDNLYRGNFTGKTLFTLISVAGGLEYESNYVDAQVAFSLATPLIPSYGVKVNFKKDFSLVENSVVFGYDREENGIHKTIRMETVWQMDQSKDYTTAKFNFDTNVIRLNKIDLAILLLKLPHPSASVDLSYIVDSGDAEFLRIRANRKKDLITIDMQSPLNALQNVSIAVSLNEQVGPNSYGISGHVYRNSHIYGITGVATFIDDIPTELDININPRDKSPSGTFYYSLESGLDGHSKNLNVQFKRSENYANLESKFSFEKLFDWNYFMSLNTSEDSLNKILIDTSVHQNKNVIDGKYIIKTPWKHLELHSIMARSNARIDYGNGRITSDYTISKTKHSAFSSWSMHPKDMHFIVSSTHDVDGPQPKIFEIDTKYMTAPNNITFEASININSVWNISTKGDVKTTETGEIVAKVILSIPQPAYEVHKITCTASGLDSNFDKINNLAILLKYDSEIAKKHMAIQTQYRDTNEQFGLTRIEWGPDSRLEAIEANALITRKASQRAFIANVATPWHNEDSVRMVGEYDVVDSFDRYKTVLNIPASKEVAKVDISVKDISNAKGMFNCSTPFLNITWFRADIDFFEKSGETNKFVQATWPENTALFNSKTVKRQISNKQKSVGDIKIEIPIQSRHLININYDLVDEKNTKNGSATIKYNDKNILNGKYGLVSKASRGTDKQEIDIELENDWKPIGVHYVHFHNVTRDLDFIKDSKKVELFELNDKKRFNIAFEFFNTTSVTGQEFMLIAIHPNRTVILSGEYDYKDTKSVHKSKVQLAPDIWVAYDYNAQTTVTDENELQIFSVQLSYPRRNLSAAGWYEVKPISFDSNVQFKWAKNHVGDIDYQDSDSAARVMSTTFSWTNETQVPDESKHKFAIGLMHPSFDKNVTFNGTYYKNLQSMFKSDFNIEYCDDALHLLTFGLNIQDLSSAEQLYKNYTTHIYVNHEASDLELDALGSIAVAPTKYEVYNIGKYKRGYIPLQDGVMFGKIDTDADEIQYYKSTPNQMINFWAKVHESYPKYNISALFEESPDTSSNGKFLLDLDDKFIWLEVNITPDATQQMQMIGMIPDARSAYFNIWRDYEEIHIDDVSYYLHMNHSRLITSKLYWRPTIKLEIKNKLKEQVRLFYEALTEGLDFWKKTIQVEVIDSTNDIWNNARPYMSNFIEDLSDIGGIQDDLDELQVFLNKSYTANDFYFKSLMNFTLTILDELALKDHIETVPKIFRELIQSMGESGQALKESIEILIEMVKSSYQKVITVIGQIFQGEMLESFSILIEQGVAKYDKWIKDLHISLIKYLENLYTKLTEMIVNSWKRILQNIEPAILRVAHYFESLVWKLSKEVFDFLYQRSNELVGSPYFNQVSNFTKDLDRFYRDIISNDAVTNFKKYSAVTWNFIQEKYFKLVPFGTELHNVLTEIYGEIKKLQTQEPFQFMIKKYNEISAKVKWVIVEFKIEQRAQQLFEVIKFKLSRLAQTALQADNQYREAKTKFIYNPKKGILELEQKLPMSWHALNETPNFEEISEYRFIHMAQELLSGSNDTIWGFYHDLKPLVDPSMWFPPFKSHAFLLGSRNYITFDRKFVMLDFKYEILDRNSGKPNQCSYLLAKDYCDGNFTLLIEPSTMVNAQNEIISNRRYTLLVEDRLVTVEILGDRIKIDNNETSLLPIRIKDLVIYREADILIMKSRNGFTFTCNMHFDYCTLELVGWYFGKTAGIFGTMNNEPYDDYLTSTHQIVSDYEEFTNSWQLPGCLNKPPINQYKTQIQQMPLELLQTCDAFFKNRGSYLATCFAAINPTEFYDACLDLGMNSIANVLLNKHPSLRGACTTALAYIDVCNEAKIPLRIPDQCIHCQLVNGSYIPEGKFVAFDNEDLIQSSDVVYIIEAKPCNEKFSTKKSMMSVASAIHSELNAVNLTNNRYAVVTFGGKPPFDEPRSIVYNSQVFTDDYRNLQHYFDHIQTGNGSNNDIFEAIIEAAKLMFRPGISKTFILVPCSQCLDDEMQLDYSSLLQLLLENGINLHIVMNDDFVYDKARLTKKFFGIDRKFAFSKQDIKDLKGDPEIRKQIRLPKQSLGVCSPLALETNGSVFTASKLSPDKKNQYKKTSLVFSKRVAQSARPQCQQCECTGHNTGIAYISCLPCEYPNAETVSSLEFDMISSDELEWDWNESDELEM